MNIRSNGLIILKEIFRKATTKIDDPTEQKMIQKEPAKKKNLLRF